MVRGPWAAARDLHRQDACVCVAQAGRLCHTHTPSPPGRAWAVAIRLAVADPAGSGRSPPDRAGGSWFPPTATAHPNLKVGAPFWRDRVALFTVGTSSKTTAWPPPTSSLSAVSVLCGENPGCGTERRARKRRSAPGWGGSSRAPDGVGGGLRLLGIFRIAPSSL